MPKGGQSGGGANASNGLGGSEPAYLGRWSRFAFTAPANGASAAKPVAWRFSRCRRAHGYISVCNG